jgi:hypothetical protein
MRLNIKVGNQEIKALFPMQDREQPDKNAKGISLYSIASRILIGRNEKGKF